MILRRVELGQFGKWTEHVFEFRRGANLVIGGNGTGKTTLAAAIPAVLFGLRDKERFVPWTGMGCDAALVWEDSQHFWRVERNVRTDEVDITVWHEGGEVLRNFSGHAEAGEPSGDYGELLRELCGLNGTEPFTAAALGFSDLDAPAPVTLVSQKKLQR
jgi:DNA repair exonuclease SbcCD ATPase subunit